LLPEAVAELGAAPDQEIDRAWRITADALSDRVYTGGIGIVLAVLDELPFVGAMVGLSGLVRA
jgi:hypothetical protein